MPSKCHQRFIRDFVIMQLQCTIVHEFVGMEQTSLASPQRRRSKMSAFVHTLARLTRPQFGIASATRACSTARPQNEQGTGLHRADIPRAQQDRAARQNGRSKQQLDVVLENGTTYDAKTTGIARFEIVQEKQLFKRYQTVYQRDVRYPDGQLVSFDILANGASQHKSVFVFPFCRATQTATLLEEYSPGPNATMMTLVAGMFEADKHEDLHSAARAELSEEAGLCDGELVPLVADMAADKYSINRFYHFLALDCRQDTRPGSRDVEEWIKVVPGVPLSEVRRVVEAGAMNAPNSVAALLALERLRQMGFES